MQTKDEAIEERKTFEHKEVMVPARVSEPMDVEHQSRVLDLLEDSEEEFQRELMAI